MQMEEIEQHATRLFNEIGPKAIATAAQRAHDAEEKGASDAAANWRRIEARLLEMRGPAALWGPCPPHRPGGTAPRTGTSDPRA